jgi:hypothetical protein
MSARPQVVGLTGLTVHIWEGRTVAGPAKFNRMVDSRAAPRAAHSSAIAKLGAIYQHAEDLLYMGNNAAAALVEAQKFESEVKAQLGTSDCQYSRALELLGTIYHSMGQEEKADSYLRRARELRTMVAVGARSAANQEIIDGFERLRRQPVEAAVEGVMLGHRIAVEIGELTQRQSVGDAFAQLAIIPVLKGASE